MYLLNPLLLILTATNYRIPIGDYQQKVAWEKRVLFALNIVMEYPLFSLVGSYPGSAIKSEQDPKELNCLYSHSGG